jgi:hypothetical protein
MSAGQRVIRAALSHLGDTERPWGSNTGPEVDRFTRFYSMHSVPWCGCFVGFCFDEADVDDAGVCSPSTAVICQRADAAGGLAPPPGRPVPPGSLYIRCGVHVELVIRDNGDGTVSNIGGNVNQQVALTRRLLSDGRIIVPPAVLEGEPEPANVYGFDDLLLRPKRYGGWATRAARERVIADLAPDVRKRVRRVRLTGGRASWAFEVVASSRWRFGPWPEKGTRDRLMREYQRNHAGRPLRAWAIEQDARDGGGPLTAGDTTN